MSGLPSGSRPGTEPGASVPTLERLTSSLAEHMPNSRVGTYFWEGGAACRMPHVSSFWRGEVVCFRGSAVWRGGGRIAESPLVAGPSWVCGCCLLSAPVHTNWVGL